MNNFILAVEIGGTYVRTGAVKLKDKENIIYDKKSFQKTGDVLQEINVNIVEPITKLMHAYREKEILGIGISLAAIVDRERGIIKTWPNHPLWNGFPILDYLKSKFSIPIIIEDDANCGVLGEYNLLDTENIKHLVYICIGTGVGCSLILNGVLYTGENGFAGEFGHINIPFYNTICTCGNVGCLQSIISGPAMLKKYNYNTRNSYLRMEDVSDKFDTAMSQCYNETVSVLSKSIYNISMLLDVSNFILGGGVVGIRNNFIFDIKEKVNDLVKPFNKKISITKAKLGEQAGIYGAIQLVENKFKNNEKDFAG